MSWYMRNKTTVRPDSEQFVSFFQAKLIIDNHDLRFVMLIHFTVNSF